MAKENSRVRVSRAFENRPGNASDLTWDTHDPPKPAHLGSFGHEQQHVVSVRTAYRPSGKCSFLPFNDGEYVDS